VVLSLLNVSPVGLSTGLNGWRAVWGLLRGRSQEDVLNDLGAGPVLRAVTGTASFGVDVLTGVEDGDHVAVGWVLFAGISDVLVLPKVLIPVRLALRAAPSVARFLPVSVRAALATHLRPAASALVHLRPAAGAVSPVVAHTGPVVLRTAARVGNIVALKPSALDGVARAVTRYAARGAPEGDGMASALAMAQGVERSTLSRASLRAADVLSLAWRPASVINDAIVHGDAGISALRDAVAREPTEWPGRALRRAYESLPPGRREAVLELARTASAQIATSSHDVASLVQMHTGSHAVVNTAAGHPMNTVPPRAPFRRPGTAVLRRARAFVRRAPWTLHPP
jgi:uncharacterized protein with PhoU and TrkA domain